MPLYLAFFLSLVSNYIVVLAVVRTSQYETLNVSRYRNRTL
jgi:hypothetical protein